MSKTDTLILIALTWAVAAYIIAPKLWAMYFRKHPDFVDLDRCSKTGDGHPGDPINIVLAGDEGELQRAMTACGWVEAKPITVASSVQIAADTVLHRADDAPRSATYTCSAASKTSPLNNPSARPRPPPPRPVLEVGQSPNPTAALSGSAAAHSTRASASATPPARSPTTSPRRSMPSATTWSPTFERPG